MVMFEAVRSTITAISCRLKKSEKKRRRRMRELRAPAPAVVLAPD
jgi:hypothetical protein